jgi:hypothetical protein
MQRTEFHEKENIVYAVTIRPFHKETHIVEIWQPLDREHTIQFPFNKTFFIDGRPYGKVGSDWDSSKLRKIPIGPKNYNSEVQIDLDFNYEQKQPVWDRAVRLMLEFLPWLKQVKYKADQGNIYFKIDARQTND